MAGGRPPKPFVVLTSEKKSHRTKAELETRKKAEEALVTGIKLKEWPEVKTNEIAHKEFKRVKKLLEKIGKNDGLHESVINRYALLRSECLEFEEKRERFYRSLEELEAGKAAGEVDWLDYLKLKASYQGQIISCDKQIMAKRKMMLDIEKENLMTIAAALRSIPKKPDKADKSPMAAFLERRQAGKNAT